MTDEAEGNARSDGGGASPVRVKSIAFGRPPFRKLGSLTIPIADRITIIAGHNGIGKSTILGLVANSSGLRGKKPVSYFNRAYQGNLYEVVHLDFASEWVGTPSRDLPNPRVTYQIGEDILVKRCSITKRKDREEIRVVPRNHPHEPFETKDGKFKVGTDGKVPIPTIYLGMTRMLPVGESDPASVRTIPDASFDAADAEFIRSFISGVIRFAPSNSSVTITTQSISGTKKTAKHPEYKHSPKSISLGQDSLSSIATALASFSKLKREDPAYLGGILIIDEIDAGFHPHAQRALIRSLRTAARNLKLQIIATTHSLATIEEVHPDLNPKAMGTIPDAVVYLTDTMEPRVAKDQSIDFVRQDMNLDPPPGRVRSVTPVIRIYLEDLEAHFFLKKLLTADLRRRIKTEVGVLARPIALSVGCENLKGFIEKDPYFKTVAIVIDADARFGTSTPVNVARLPGGIDASGKGLNPEGTIFSFILEIVSEGFPEAHEYLADKGITSDQLREHLLLDRDVVGDRKSAKAWFDGRKQLIDKWEIVETWAMFHPAEVNAFEDRLIAAIRAARDAGR